MYSVRVSSSCSNCGARHVTVKRREHYVMWKSCWEPVYVNKKQMSFIRHEPQTGVRGTEHSFLRGNLADITTRN
jgi:hypothetical protein